MYLTLEISYTDFLNACHDAGGVSEPLDSASGATPGIAGSHRWAAFGVSSGFPRGAAFGVSSGFPRGAAFGVGSGFPRGAAFGVGSGSLNGIVFGGTSSAFGTLGEDTLRGGSLRRVMSGGGGCDVWPLASGNTGTVAGIGTKVTYPVSAVGTLEGALVSFAWG